MSIVNKRFPSNLNHDFSKIPNTDLQRSAFDRVSSHKTTFDSGYLVPWYIDEVLPGDTFNFNATLFARLATPLVPFMDNLYLDWFAFYIPNRLLQDNWVKLMGEQINPGDSISFLTPIVSAPAVTGFAINSLYDYFGVRTGVPGISVCNYWGRGYNLCFNTWFRDQNLQNSAVVDTDDGPDSASDYVLRRRGKRHDYFTSCLPWPQKGPSVPLPLTGNAPVVGIGITAGSTYVSSGTGYKESDGTAGVGNNWKLNAGGNNDIAIQEHPTLSGYPGIFADLSSVTATTINSLREAFQLQRLYERDARGGTRYTEILRSHFLIKGELPLYRPEFLGGSSTAIVVNPIAQTVSGEVTGSGIGAIGQLGSTAGVVAHASWTKSFVEHGIIICLMNVRADLTYQQGTHRMFFRRTKHDFYWPALAHLGEQAVLNQEIYTQGSSADTAVFGYQERWAEYRYKPSLITGKLRSDFVPTLDWWHLAQDFASLPTLSSSFIEENVPLDRVLSVNDTSLYGAQMVFDSHIRCRTVRGMPTYSVPGMIDHF